MDNLTHFKKVKKSEYLGSWDLPNGVDINVTIERVEQRTIKDIQGKESLCNIAIFTDKKLKPMVINLTNGKVIQSFTQDNTPYIEKWKNIPVTLYVDFNIKVGRNVVDGLRIRPIQPKKELPQATEQQITASIEAIKTGKKEKMPAINWFKKNTIITDEQLKRLESL